MSVFGNVKHETAEQLAAAFKTKFGESNSGEIATDDVLAITAEATGVSADALIEAAKAFKTMNVAAQVAITHLAIDRDLKPNDGDNSKMSFELGDLGKVSCVAAMVNAKPGAKDGEDAGKKVASLIPSMSFSAFHAQSTVKSMTAEARTAWRANLSDIA